MSATLEKVKELSKSGKYPVIIDTMGELCESDVARELGHNDFYLYHVYTYETCKRIIFMGVRGIPEKLRPSSAYVISNFRYLTSDRVLAIANGLDPEPVKVAVPGELPGQTEVITVSEEIPDMFECMKLRKDLLDMISEARKVGIEVYIMEGEHDNAVNVR